MTYRLGKTSLNKLGECDARLQQLAMRAIEYSPYDFGITCGHRDKAEQGLCCAAGLSKAPWPTSKHNSIPARAFDFVPYIGGKPDWNDRSVFKAVGVHILSVAKEMGIKVRWGGDFHMDGDKTTTDAWDMPHIELHEV